MLYLEDYLELIEHLPQEFRDRFIDIRERDLQVHNSAEQLKEKVKHFFAEAKQLDPEQRQCNYQTLLNEYDETMKFADDKVQIANQMHDIMVKLVQRLDGELDKFKLELEGAHYGNNLSSFGNEIGFKNLTSDSTTTTITAAAAATNTNNLQNIDDSIDLPFEEHQSALGSALGSANAPSNPALATMNTTSIHNKISTTNNNVKSSSQHLTEPNSPLVKQNSMTNLMSNNIYHRDETKYCICRQISYGEMVACDNDECEIEWFHYNCVGITQPPKDKWFCPDCTRKMTGFHHHHQQHTTNQTHTHKKRGRKEKSVFNLVNNPVETVRSKDLPHHIVRKSFQIVRS